MKNTAPVHLQDPDEISLENAYRSLPGKGEISLETTLTRLASQLDKLENAGFAGMRINAFGSTNEKIIVRACKGKQGICYNTGRSARYHGAALAALDDDHHLLFVGDEIPVCEKTATLYSMTAYRGLIQCTEADKGLLEKLQTDPELFDCGNFEVSLEKLFVMVRVKKQAEEFTDLFYPGPFKLLVLQDGTIVHRGRINKVPVKETKKLLKEDGLFRIDGKVGGTHESFTELYSKEGPRCLLNEPQGSVIADQKLIADLSSLNNISRNLRSRLIGIIENKKDYFILTGSNREDEYGCCPSDEVTVADKLVRAGILSASREPSSADTCPVTIYAFRKEMASTQGNLHFNLDDNFRKEVLSRVKNNPRSMLKMAIRLILLGFVAITVILAFTRLSGPKVPLSDISLYDQLEISRPDGTVVVLFRYNKRCVQCLAMEKYAREVLMDQFTEKIQKNQIEFRHVIMDLDVNRSLIDSLGLFTSTLVIIRYEGGEKESVRVLERSWSLYNNELEFKKMLSEELRQMMAEKDE